MKIIGLLALFFLFSVDVSADPFPAQTSDDFWNSFDEFFIRLSSFVQILISPGTDLYSFVKMLMVFFSVISLVTFIIQFTSTGIKEMDLVVLIISIFAPTIFLTYYDQITTEGWILAGGISDSIQAAAIGSNSRGGIYGFMDVLWTNISLTADTINPVKIIARGLRLAVFFILQQIFMVGVALATMWAVWGYAIAKIIGIIFIPLSILPITRYFFVNWIKLYIGFLFYLIIARVNLVIVYLLTVTIFKLPVNIAASSSGSVPVYTIDMSEAVPTSLFVLLFVGIISMISVGSIASSLVSGGANLSSGIGKMAARKVL